MLRIKQPASALAGKNIVLTGKGVNRVKGAGLEVFDRCPYEVLDRQGVLPSVIKPGAPDYVDIYAGRLAGNDKQTISFSAQPTAGGFTLTVLGQTTASIPAASAASAVQSALVALSNIGAGNVSVTGSQAAGYVVEFIGTLAGKDVGPIVVGTNTLSSPSATLTIVETQKGGAQALAPELDMTKNVLQIDLLPGTTTPRSQVTSDGNTLWILKRVEFSRNAGV